MARKNRVNFKTSGSNSGGLKPPAAGTSDGGEINNPYVDPRKEYLSGGVLSTGIGINSNFDFSRTLGGTNDDLMQEFGYSIYSQMSKDPKISKCIKLIQISVLGDGIEFLPCVSDNNPEYESAKKISDFCTYAIKNMNKPIRVALEQMLEAIIYGHKIAEIVYRNEYIEEFGGTFLTVEAIKPKPIGLARFVVDQSMNVLGIVGNGINSSAGQKSPSQKAISSEKAGIEVVNPDNIYQRGGKTYVRTSDGQENVFLNLDKFMVLTINTEDEDPRGRSMLRAAFNFWHLKQQVIPEYLRYLLTCSIPLLIGYTPEIEGAAAYVKNPDGSIKKDSLNRPLQMNQEEALREALMQARNATTLALKGGSKVQEVGANGSGIPFYKALEVFNSEIESSIVLQTLASSDSKFNTRAASETHLSVFEQLAWSLKECVADMLTHYLLKPLVKYNFGKQYLKYLPSVSLGDSERRNFALDGATISALYSVKYMSEDQKRYTDRMLGLPVRDPNYEQSQITPDEAFRYSDAILQQAKLEAEIKKEREAAKLERVNQIVGLQTILQAKSVGADGKATSNVDSGVAKAINDLTIAIMKDIQGDVYDQDVTRITATLLNAGKNAKKVFTPEALNIGDTGAVDIEKSISSDIVRPKPVSGDPAGIQTPYISTENKSSAL